MNFSALANFLAHPTWDIIVLFVFIAVGFFYGISASRSKLIAILFSLYVSGFIFENFYYLGNIVKGRTLTEEFMFRSLIFLVIAIVLAILFVKVMRGEYDGEKMRWWKSFLLSFASVGLLFSYIFHLFPAKEIFTFSPAVQVLFASSSAFFWWLVLPLVALFLDRK